VAEWVDGQGWLAVATIDTLAKRVDHGAMTERLTRNVSLPTSQEDFIEAMVRSGRYRTASEVVRDGLRLLEEAEHRRRLEDWLCGGVDEATFVALPLATQKRLKAWFDRIVEVARRDIAAGRVEDGPEVMKRLARKLRARR
jgi:putative addiction module CopG family antidote